jgi:phospholipase C
MSTCKKWVDQGVITCKNWASQIDYECTSWADQGSNQCSQWADQGSSQCTSWEECHWYTPWNCIAGFFCRAYYWVANWVCQAWYWVANWVCQAWYWLAKWVCKAFAWIIKAVCVVWSWVMKLVCVAWDTLTCALKQLGKWLASLFSKDRGINPKIEHVFVLMLENRSFDHMFGFSGITGFDLDGNPTTFNEGFDPTVNKNFNPVTMSDVFVNQPADFQLKDIDQDPGHEFEDTLTALCGKDAVYIPAPGGYPPINNSGFVQNYYSPKDPGSTGSTTPERIMKCYNKEQLPVLNALAREFAICDKWFSSLPGPTWPNRFFLLAATSGGLDGSPSKGDIISATTVEGYRFENGNIFDLLDDNCIDWRIFEGDEFPVSFALNGMNLNALQGRFKDFNDFESEVNKADFSEKFIFIEPQYGAHKFDVTGPGDFTCGNSMHPLDDVTRGEKLVKKVYETIRNSPHWEKSMLLVTFDEHGGFYDHLAPPSAVPPGDLITDAYVQNHFQFDQLGVRVPSIVISPYTKRNVIDHTIYDHTSMLATVERLFGMRNLTNRDKAANDFLHLISLNSPRNDTPTTLPDAAVNPHPLSCEEDDSETAKRLPYKGFELRIDQLLYKRTELTIAREKGIYKEKNTCEFKLTPTQIGFVQVALLRILQNVEYPERIGWIEDFKKIESGIDAAIFMIEAKLKLRYSIDFKKIMRESRQKENALGP